MSFYDSNYAEITGSLTGYLTPPDKVPESRTLVINSCGGSNSAGSVYYDWVRYHGLNTFAMGDCSSYAFMIFTAGERRECFPSTVFMMHGSDCPMLYSDDRHTRRNGEKTSKAFRESVTEAWIDRMVSISTMDRKYWEDVVRTHKENTYFTAKQLLEMGVVTKILT